MEKNFRFWMPLDMLEKAGKDGKKTMKVGGIASTNKKDMDGESLDPSGFDLSYFKNKGIVNWNHNKSPDAVIGEPTSVELRPEGLYVEAELYGDSPLAKSVYSLAETLHKSSKTRKLGFSIEGKATERDANDKTKVSKAMITNIALTMSPKNPDSIVDIVKGEFNELSDGELVPYNMDFVPEFEVEKLDKIEKALNTSDASSGKPLTKESVEGKLKNQIDNIDEDEEEITKKPKTLTKGQVISRLLKSNSVITFEKANQAFEILNNLEMSEKQETNITEDTLNKALAVLGLQDEDTEDLRKGVDDTDDDDEEEEEEVEENPVPKKKAKVEDDGDIKKSLDLLATENIEMFKGVGTLLKGIYDAVTEQGEENQSLREEITELKKGIEELSGTPAGVRKSTSRPLGRNFEKGFQGQEDNGDEPLNPNNVMSVSANKPQVLAVLDKMAFEKGFNPDLAKAMTVFESSGNLEKGIIDLIRAEKGITLVK